MKRHTLAIGNWMALRAHTAPGDVGPYLRSRARLAKLHATRPELGAVIHPAMLKSQAAAALIERLLK